MEPMAASPGFPAPSPVLPVGVPLTDPSPSEAEAPATFGRAPAPLCTLEVCGRRRFRRGFCVPHYFRARAHGALPALNPASVYSSVRVADAPPWLLVPIKLHRTYRRRPPGDPIPPPAVLVIRVAGDRCPGGACYLFGGDLPCIPGCFHCAEEARFGVRPRPSKRLRPCPRCGHLPERVKDPGPYPRLNTARTSSDCAFCGTPLLVPNRKFCNDECFNGLRRHAGNGGEEHNRFEGAYREKTVHRVALDPDRP